MQMIYRCEVCGKEFDDYETASQHEKLCQEKHATGFRLAEELNKAVETARQNGKLSIAVDHHHSTSNKILNVYYDANCETVIIQLD